MTMSNDAGNNDAGGGSLLRRWALRKQAAKAPPPPPAQDVAPEPTPEPPPDLPDVDTLGLASDYTAFLQTGVPAELQRLALQRAWQTDERIAGFRGMADYDWDFNAPSYGKLWATDDVAKLVQAVLAPPPEDPPAVPPPALDPPPDQPAVMVEAPAPPEAEPAPDPAPPATRRHGSALPC